MPQAVIGRWGKNLAIRLPAEIAKSVGFGDGQRVEIVSSNHEVVIRRLPPTEDLEALFAGRAPEAWRALYADAFDWGPDQGRERVDE